MSLVFQFPPGNGKFVARDGAVFFSDVNGRISIDPKYTVDAHNAGAVLITNTASTVRTMASSARFTAPIAAELVSIKAAAIAANGVITIAAQPDYPRKLQIRQVIVTAITAGNLALVGTDVHGNTVSENVSLIAATTQTLKTVNAFAHLTSGTVSAIAGGGDGTLGIGVAADLGLPCDQSLVTGSVVVFKENDDNADAVVGTVDATAATISPTTAPNGTHNFTIWYSFQSSHVHAENA